MDHRQQLYLYWSDELEPAQRRRFGQHLERCGECRQELAALGGVARAVRELPRHAPPRNLLEAAVEQALGRRWWQRLAPDGSARTLAPGVAVLVLAVVVGAWLSTPPPRETPLPTTQVVTAGQLERRLAALEQAVASLRDGTGRALRTGLHDARRPLLLAAHQPQGGSGLERIRTRLEAIKTGTPGLGAG